MVIGVENGSDGSSPLVLERSFWGHSLTVLGKNRARALTVAVPFPEQCVFAMVSRTRDALVDGIHGIFLGARRWGHCSVSSG